MSSLSPDPGFDYYYKAWRKGEPEAKAVTVKARFVRLRMPVRITGRPRDNFEMQRKLVAPAPSQRRREVERSKGWPPGFLTLASC